ncbi:hypothetical protein ABZ851_00245 [Streptomyces sp. NPDC047049]|uniref:hypothetical protein n=1 Tax=Streptomyces sp. NPDC047049 TaxID=3156688 RepID=UPI003400738E
MSELERQQALARFLTDPLARQAVLDHAPADGPAWPGRQDIADRLRELDQPRVSMFSRLLLANRVAKIADVLPLTAWTLGERLTALVEEYSLRSPALDPKKRHQALAFADFLQKESERTAAPGPAYLPDVLAYETALVRIRLTPASAPAPHLPQVTADLHRVRPRLAPSALLLALDHDIEEIVACHDRGEPPPPAGPRRTLLLLQGMPDGSVRQDEINQAVAMLLQACTGSRTLAAAVDELAAHLSPSPPPDRLAAHCLDLCTSLAERGAITLR